MTYAIALLLLLLTLIGMAGAVLAGRWRGSPRLVLGGATTGRSRGIDEALRAVALDLAAVARGRRGGLRRRAALKGSWARVLELMRLGQAPGLRHCQHCGGVDVAAAQWCLYCSRPLDPDRP